LGGQHRGMLRGTRPARSAACHRLAPIVWDSVRPLLLVDRLAVCYAE
jgi:hypothetical protein